MRLFALIVLLFLGAARLSAQTILSMAIREDGWSYDIWITNFTTATEFFTGFTNYITSTFTNYNIPSHTNGLELSMTSKGFTDGVFSANKSRTIYGTGTNVVRLAYPGQFTNDITVSGGVARIRGALSSRVSSNDTALLVTVRTNAYKDGSTYCAGITNLSVTNRSTIGYGRAWAIRTCPDENRETNATMLVSVMGAQKLTRGTGETLDAVDIITTGLTSGVITTNRINSMSIQYNGDALPQPDFNARISLTPFTQGERVRIDYVCYGMYGITNDCLDTRLNLYAPETRACSWTNLVDKQNLLCPYIAFVGPSGNDSGAVAVTNGSTSGTNFLSINAAVNAVLNSNNYKAVMIFVLPGITNSGGSTVTLTNTPLSMIQIYAATNGTVDLSFQSGTQDLKDRVEWIGMNFRSSFQAFSGTDKLRFTDCTHSNGAANAILTCKAVEFYRGKIQKSFNNGVRPSSIEDTSFFLRGVDLNGVGDPSSTHVISARMMGCVIANTARLRYKVQWDYSTGQAASPEFGLVYGCAFMAGQDQVFSLGENLPITNGAFAGNLLIEFATNSAATAAAFLCTKLGARFDDITMANVTAVGQRFGFCYIDTTDDNLATNSWRDASVSMVIDEEYGTKSDTLGGSENTQSTNNWIFRWQVDCIGNFHGDSSPAGGSGFQSEFMGFYMYDLPGSETNPPSFMHFINRQTYTGSSNNPPGNGFYQVASNSPVLGSINSISWALPNDLNMKPRTAANNMAGAYAESGADYFVSLGGDDNNTGHPWSQWRTIAHALSVANAGDRIYLSGGDYNEYVTTVRAGYSGAPITIKANPTNTFAARTRQFRMSHPFNKLDGITVDKSIDTDSANQNNAHVLVDPAAEGTVITNCWISDTPLVNGYFHMSTNGNKFTLTHTNGSTGNFIVAGFVAGGLCYMGADSSNYYTNHDRGVQCESVTTNSITFTNSAGTNFLTEPVQGKWATIYAGQGNSGYNGILLNLGSGVQGPTNCLIIGNTFSNMSGAFFIIYGESNRVERNYCTKNNGLYGFRPFGRHPRITLNTFIDCTNRIFFADHEYGVGSGTFDFQVGFEHMQAANTFDVLIALNWFQNIQQQAGVFDKQNQTNIFQFNVISNVFVGCATAFSQNIDYVTNRYNTFYRCSYDASHALAAGGPSGGNLATNLDISYNAFVDCGRQHAPSTGWYSTENTSAPNLTNNFACGAESTGWHAKDSSATGPITYNGGDPSFLNKLNPLGADGLAFTADDGLRPLPNSALAINGVGALSAATVTAGIPIAHFSLVGPTNWLDYVYTNFNLSWLTNAPPDRGGPVRDWTVPDPIVNVPGEVHFTASNSIGGLTAQSTNNAGIVAYSWDFGDGYRRTVSTNTEAWHRFPKTGEVTVVLYVTNSLGGSSVYSNVYRVLPYTNFAHKVWYANSATGSDSNNGTNQNSQFLTVGKIETVAGAGDIAFCEGNFTNEVLDISPAVATVSDRIEFIALGAKIGGLNIRHPNYTFRGWETTGHGISEFGALYYLYPPASNTYILDAYAHDITNRYGVFMEVPSDPHPLAGQSSCIMSNTFFNLLQYVQFSLQGSNHLVTQFWIGNTGRTNGEEGDAFRLHGSNHRIRNGYLTNIWGGHGDLFQAFGPSQWCKDHIIEGVTADGATNGQTALCQFELDPAANYDYTNQMQMTNCTWRNNVFRHISHGNVDMSGTKWYNNGFYYCIRWETNFSGHTLVFGGRKGSYYGTELYNNLFFQCGNGTNTGWYPTTNDFPGEAVTNGTIVADYNAVIGDVYAAMPEAPPNDTTHFKAFNQDAHAVNGGNPMFVDASAFNFHLSTGSPLINAGTTISSFSTDADGVSRPQSEAWDIGPFEFLESGASETIKVNTIIRGRVSISGNVIIR